MRIRFLSSGHFSKSRFLKRPNMGPCHKIVSRRQKYIVTGHGLAADLNTTITVIQVFIRHAKPQIQILPVFMDIQTFRRLSFLAGKAGFGEYRKWRHKYIVPKYSGSWCIFLIVPIRNGLLNPVKQHVKKGFPSVRITM